jgi:insertion element IS1 protein InsB
MSRSVRINGGSGWLSVVELGKSWQMRKGTVRPKPACGSGAGFNEATAQEYRQAKSFSDFWKSYRPVFEDDSSHQQVGKSSGEMAHVERFFGRLRQKLAQQVRRTRAASESERMLHLTTKLFVEWYNEAIT